MLSLITCLSQETKKEGMGGKYGEIPKPSSPLKYRNTNACVRLLAWLGAESRLLKGFASCSCFNATLRVSQ